MDHTTDEDLTAVTLTQIIFEQEKRNSGFLPKSVLTGLVRAGGDTLNTLRRNLNSPLELLKHVDEEIEKRLQALVERGEMAKEEAINLSEKLLAAGQEKAKRLCPASNAWNAYSACAACPPVKKLRSLPAKSKLCPQKSIRLLMTKHLIQITTTNHEAQLHDKHNRLH